jgi:sugar/nucleoside kinase (ribokinase family)
MTVVEGEHTSYTLAITPPGIDRIFLHSRGTNNTFGFDDVNYDVVAAAKVFHFGYPPLMKRIYEHSAAELTRIFRKAKEVGATTSLDMALPDPASPAGKEDWDAALRNTLPYVDLYLPSGEETLFMLDRATFARRREEAGHKDVLDYLRIEDLQAVAEKVLAYGAKLVVLKCGHLGMYLRTAPARAWAGLGACPPADIANWAGRELWEPAYHVENVASATGSGDSAIAGFLSAYVRGLSLEQCLQYGCAVGAFNVTAFDAVSGIRSWEETTAAIRGGWVKNPVPLVERAAGWRREAAAATWLGPGDRRG